MLRFFNVSRALLSMHDVLFDSFSHNPWIDGLKYVWEDSDHMFGLVPPVAGIICTLFFPLYLPYSVLFPPRRREMSNTSKLAIAATLAYCACYIYEHETSHGLADLIHGTDPKLQSLLKRCPLMKRGPKPPVWFANRHIQFIPWILQNEMHKRDGAVQYQRHEFTVTDCVDKSVPDCTSHDSMNDTISLDVFPPFSLSDEVDNSTDFPRSTPVILFAPGLRCHSQDLPSNSIVRAVYGNGFRSIVVNRRGHTPGSLLRAPRWNLFGDVYDLEQVYWHIKRNMIDPGTPMFLHGISSGCAVVVSALAAWDKRSIVEPHLPSPKFVGAVAVTPGYDTSKVLEPNRFKWPYNPLMAGMVKDHFLSQNEKVLRDFNATAFDAAMAAKSLQDVLDASAPFAGYPDASSYYAHANPVNDLHYISSPVYVLNSLDDPCCRIGNLYERSEQPQHGGKSYAEMVAESERGIVAVTKTGSHCPFLDSPTLVRDPATKCGTMLNSWADQSIAEFYVAALDVYNDRRFL
mmetsp:Transcript_48947/g.147447  ORF Transcript_48947/g.147447 Transcript_48947/m.147447 type:complete len:517 (-) Transcript_48947:123-1673(-)